MTTSTQWYLDAIERELADLPADERAELLEDLAAHFGEFANDDDLASTLGDPAAYARELRDAAGLSASPPPEAHIALIDRLRANVTALRRSSWWRAIAAFLPELRPAWWVLRAWLIVAALAGGVDFPVPRVADHTLVGLAALMIVVPVSVKLGQQARRGQRKGLNVALTVFGALFCLILPASANDGSGDKFDASTFPIATGGAPSTVGVGKFSSTQLWVYDSAGNGYFVTRIRTTPDGHTEVQALCPSDVALPTADGAAIVCVGRLSPGASAPVAPPTTTAPSTITPTTIAPPTTLTPSTTGVSESTR
ncbi:MAG: hypothetical protein E6G39_21040 [Actinobacteria bacterium]|nr:MAG: hypothetical protein E6G39_21040 [Actinomycetota bacterium]